ncbi:MAG: hypothetical protein OEM52_03805 [bacterium]|nr:hypothetical protein [bacterium]
MKLSFNNGNVLIDIESQQDQINAYKLLVTVTDGVQSIEYDLLILKSKIVKEEALEVYISGDVKSLLVSETAKGVSTLKPSYDDSKMGYYLTRREPLPDLS